MRDEGRIRIARRRLFLTIAGWSVLLLGAGLAAAALFWHGGPSMLFPGVVLWLAVLVGALFWVREAAIAVDDARGR